MNRDHGWDNIASLTEQQAGYFFIYSDSSIKANLLFQKNKDLVPGQVSKVQRYQIILDYVSILDIQYYIL